MHPFHAGDVEEFVRTLWDVNAWRSEDSVEERHREDAKARDVAMRTLDRIATSISVPATQPEADLAMRVYMPLLPDVLTLSPGRAGCLVFVIQNTASTVEAGEDAVQLMSWTGGRYTITCIRGERSRNSPIKCAHLDTATGKFSRPFALVEKTTVFYIERGQIPNAAFFTLTWDA